METAHLVRRKSYFIAKYSKVLVVMVSGRRSRTDRPRRLRRPSRSLRTSLPSPHGAPSRSRLHSGAARCPSSRCCGSAPGRPPVAEMRKRYQRRRLRWSRCRASGTPVGGLVRRPATRRPRALRAAAERAGRAAAAALPAGSVARSVTSLAMCRPPPARRCWCPRWDSNPHCRRFELRFSTGWNTGTVLPTASVSAYRVPTRLRGAAPGRVSVRTSGSCSWPRRRRTPSAGEY